MVAQYFCFQKANMHKVLFINEAHPILPSRLTQLGYTCHFDYQSSKSEIERQLAGFEGVVLRSRMKVDKAFIDAGINLKFIAREGVGVEHIDVAYAESKGIKVLTSPEGSQDTVAEHSMGLLLTLLNNLSRADRQVRAGQWLREANRATELKGKTIGIIGYGNMGRAFAQRLQGFGVRVIAYDKYKTNYGDEHAAAVDLETLFKQSDIISLHIYYIPENYHFVNAAFLDAFQKPIYVINTARGLVLNTADLVERLQSGKVLGAALDVLEYEEQSFARIMQGTLPAPFQYLTQADNVVLSPHIAGWSFESKAGHGRVLADKIAALELV